MPLLVVGAGPGMGLAIAEALGPAHGPVALIARRRAVLDELAAGLRRKGVDAWAFPADVGDETSLREAIVAARAQVGPFTVVVFNPSLFVAGPPTKVDLNAFRRGLEVGVTAALVTMQATVDDLLAAAPDSALLLTGGGLALSPWPEGIGLAVQKAGLRHLALAAAQELRPMGVSVSTVTIRGTIAAGGPFDPTRIAAVYAALAEPGRQRPVEVTVSEDGPDWPD
jgi:NAD(P)-dependent dehydrogenase (short-subunit alcohol dehydrogenase family)